MKNNDIENLVKGGESVYQSALAVLICTLGACIVTLLAILSAKL